MTSSIFQSTFTENFCNPHFLQQLPGVFLCVDPMNKISFCNQASALLMGFNKFDEVLGIGMGDIRCKAAECADIFAAQNKQVIDENASLKILDIHPYRDDRIVALLTQKTPYFDVNNNLLGVLMNSTEITNNKLINISMALANVDKQFRSKKNVNQQSYKIAEKFDNSELTNRELECLFYLVRGKTAGGIADILFVSKKTIEKHLSNIKDKLKCPTKADLIEKALNNHFLDFIPTSIFMRAKANISVIV